MKKERYISKQRNLYYTWINVDGNNYHISSNKTIEAAISDRDRVYNEWHGKNCWWNNKDHMIKHPLYSIWVGMKFRCTNPKSDWYYMYGERGITVCNNWLNSFSKFIFDMGDKPTKVHTLDRIDNSKGYSKDNCRWATPTEQANNTRRNVNVTIEGEVMSFASAVRKYGVVPYGTAYRRYNAMGIDAVVAITSPKWTKFS